MKIVNNDKDMSLYITSLKFLSNCLSKYHNEKVIILINEYDVPLENAFFEGFYNEKIKLSDMTKMFNAIVNKEPEVFEVELNNLLLETISFNDAYENFYHGFLAGVLSNMKGYIVKSNREGGTGRSDLFIKSVSIRGIAIVIDFKIANDIDNLEKKADEAIEQIEDRRYDMELRSEGYKNIFKYGIAFYKKDCLIKMKD